MSTVIVVGDAAVDVVAAHAGRIVPGGDSRARVTVTTGGAGANTAAWLAWSGVETILVARVGDDVAGRQALEELTTAGVRCAFTFDKDAPTCCVVVLVDGDGQRTMLPDHGAGGRLTEDDLDPDLLTTADHLHLSGYVLLDDATRDAGLAMLAAARSAGLTTSVDPQSAALITDPTRFLAEVRGVDLLLPNADEMAALGPEPLVPGVGAVVTTRGAAGATWHDERDLWAVPAAQVDVLDATGAGDAFDAGYLASMLAGDPLERSLVIANACGALSTRALGGVDAQPTMDEVLGYLGGGEAGR
jgi:sugar/nucleoside kinase (ribokinase family)